MVTLAPPLTLEITRWLWSDSEEFEIWGLTGPCGDVVMEIFESPCWEGREAARVLGLTQGDIEPNYYFSVSCLAMYTGTVGSELTSEAFQRLCTTSTPLTSATTSPRTRAREAPNLKFLRIAPKPLSDPQSQWWCWYDH